MSSFQQLFLFLLSGRLSEVSCGRREQYRLGVKRLGEFRTHHQTGSMTDSTHVSLRLFAIVPLVLAIFTSRRLLHLPEKIHSTSSILNLSTSLLLSNPYLLALSPLMLILALLGSIPFLTLSFRLLLMRYFPTTPDATWEWHVKGWAEWSITGTIAVWLWSWGVARGILRTTCAAVIGAWYFSP